MAAIKILKFFFLSFFILFSTACSPSKQESNSDLDQWVRGSGKPRILATTAIVGGLVQIVGGDNIDLLILMGRDLDPHSYEVVKGDAEKFKYADLVFSNGLFLEHSGSMQSELRRHKGSIRLGDILAKKYPQEILFVSGQPDPHIWMDLSIWSKCVDPIVQSLSEKDPSHAKEYEKRGKELVDLLQEKELEVMKKIHTIPENKRYLVTSHDAFNYFGRRYLATETEIKTGEWRERVRAIQGLAPDEQISPLEILEIVDHIVKRNIGVIFPEANLSQDALRKVVDSCQRKGKNVSLCKETLYGDTLGGKSYIYMIDHNVGVLLHCLQEAPCG
jgi:manganese/zinc/iron transport system substrate-binding protein